MNVLQTELIHTLVAIGKIDLNVLNHMMGSGLGENADEITQFLLIFSY